MKKPSSTFEQNENGADKYARIGMCAELEHERRKFVPDGHVIIPAADLEEAIRAVEELNKLLYFFAGTGKFVLGAKVAISVSELLARLRAAQKGGNP